MHRGLPRMRAALVTAFDHPPSFGSFSAPTPGPSDVLIRVRAAAVSPVVRLGASGALYAADTRLPLVPGIDGVGHLVDDPTSRVYFAFPPAPYGALAETVAVPRSLTLPIPDGLSDVAAAALANPAMSSWTSLTRRTRLQPGETILINGATGIAGRLAIQVARHLGAARIIATGRSAARLQEVQALGAHEVVLLEGSKEEMVARFRTVIRSGVDVILDYLWGASAEQLLAACVNAGSRTEPARRIRWVNVGSSGGGVASMAPVAFRSSRLEMLGSGLGSETDSEQMACIGETFKVAQQAGFSVQTTTAAIEDVEKAWTTGEKDKRLVITFA